MFQEEESSSAEDEKEEKREYHSNQVCFMDVTETKQMFQLKRVQVGQVLDVAFQEHDQVKRPEGERSEQKADSVAGKNHKQQSEEEEDSKS